jgi:hypothetical protein
MKQGALDKAPAKGYEGVDDPVSCKKIHNLLQIAHAKSNMR